MDGRRIRNNKVAFSNLSGIVWTGPEIEADRQRQTAYTDRQTAYTDRQRGRDGRRKGVRGRERF